VEASQLTELARRIDEAISVAPDRTAGTMRPIRSQASAQVRSLAPDEVLQLALLLLECFPTVPRWFIYEMIHCHRPALAHLDSLSLSQLGRGMSSWGEVDAFAGYLAGMAWRDGRLSDAEVHEWARSHDRWWRRAALISTIPLNRKALGGSGDVLRTLEVCELLKADRDDMVVKALSWALRELAKRDPAAVTAYLQRAGPELAARVLREVRNKLETGLKNPRRPSRKS